MANLIELFSKLNFITQTLIATTFSWLMTALGASVVFLLKKDLNKYLMSLLFALASGIMVASSIFSMLIPSVDIFKIEGYSAALFIPLMFMLGCAAVLLIRFSFRKNQYKNNITLVASVTFHNIPEGMSVGIAFAGVFLFPQSYSMISAILLTIGIGLQNIPEGSAVALPLYSSGMNKKKAFFYGQFSGFVELLFGVGAAALTIIMARSLPFLLSIAAGMMIFVSIIELIPPAFKYNKWICISGFTLGFTVMTLLDVFL